MKHTLTRMRWLAALAALTLVAAAGWSLEVRDGRIKLVLHEDLGRFSVYYLSDLQKGTYVPLFVDTDPRTSSTTLMVDNRVARLGESADYQQEARRSAKGAEFVWSSRILQIQQSFEFVTSESSQLADGVRVTTAVKNLGEQRLQIALRTLLDTYLGEEGSFHFVADGQRQISREAELTGSGRPAFWSSPRHGDAAALGLTVLTSGDGIDTPERIVFANWQRLNDSSWTYQTSANRSFSNLPYSINDSAVAMYWGPRSVESGQSFSVSTLIAKGDASGYRAAAAAGASAASPASTDVTAAVASTRGIADPLLAARADMKVLDALLAAIDQALADPSTLTAARLAELQGAAKELADRIARYAAGQAPSTARP